METTEIQHVAWLARIAADDEELEAYRAHFDRLLDFVEDLRSAPTEGIEPMAHPLDATQRLRTDEVTDPGNRERHLELAPDSEHGYFLVPKVIE